MKKQRKALGKGLDALLGETSIGIEIAEVEIDKIKPSEGQPRKEFKNINELAQSIKSIGIINPLIVVKNNDGTYELVAGERRWRAAKKAGLKKVPVIINKYSEEEKLEISLIENIQRQDLNPVEEATAYKILIEKFKLTQEELAKRVGKDRSTIANTLRLLTLPKKVLNYLKEGKLQEGHVRPLINIKNPDIVIKLAEKIINEKIPVREVEKLSKVYKPVKEVKRKKEKKTDAYLQELEDTLREYFGTKVRLTGNKDKGKVVIEYYSKDGLIRIIKKIMKEE